MNSKKLKAHLNTTILYFIVLRNYIHHISNKNVEFQLKTSEIFQFIYANLTFCYIICFEFDFIL